nr:hypothetical protein [Paludibacteraceae bacterium]
ARLIVMWATDTPDMMLHLDPKLHTFIGENKGASAELMCAYIAASEIFAIDNKVSEMTLDSYSFAMEETILYYSKNKKRIGKLKSFEKMLKMSDTERKEKFTNLYQESKGNNQ